jgi:hypothetical protein
MLEIALRQVVTASRVYNSPTQNDGNFHPAIISSIPININMDRPNVFLTNKMQEASIANPIPHVPIRTPALLVRRSMSMIPPSTAVP